MNPIRRVLVALDDSETSRHAVEWVGRTCAHDPDVAIELFHVMGPMPTDLLEHGGASDPGAERLREADLERRQATWLAEARVRFQHVFQDAEHRLVEAGVDPNAIATRCVESIPEDDLPALVALEAERAACDTVVVGRNAYSWVQEMVHEHVGEALARMAPQRRVEVVP